MDNTELIFIGMDLLEQVKRLVLEETILLNGSSEIYVYNQGINVVLSSLEKLLDEDKHIVHIEGLSGKEELTTEELWEYF